MNSCRQKARAKMDEAQQLAAQAHDLVNKGAPNALDVAARAKAAAEAGAVASSQSESSMTCGNRSASRRRSATRSCWLSVADASAG